MAVYDWPEALWPQRASIGSAAAVEQFKSPHNGTLQAADYVAERWVLSVTLPQARRVNAGAVEAFFFPLRGGVHRVNAWHFSRPVPVGTMRGSPTLSATVTRGAETLVIANGGANATLRAGDLFSIGGQLFMARTDVQFNGSGVGTVPLVHRVRATISSGTAVLWNRPTAQFVMPNATALVSHFPGGIEGAAFDFEEAW